MKNRIVTVTLNPCIDKSVSVDKLAYGGLNRVKKIRTDIGGKGINVSKVLKNLGADVFACGITAGNEVPEFLEEYGIDSCFTVINGRIRTNLKVFDEDSLITTEINEAGFELTEAMYDDFVKKLETVLPSAELLILSGSVPYGADPCIYRSLIELARKENVRVILDTDGEKLKQGIKAAPFVIKPNLFEFEQLVGKRLCNKDDIIFTAREFLTMGIELVIVSLGADGALFVNKKGALEAKPFPIKCRSTVAAGDSMVAAAAYAIQNGYTLEKLAKLATAAGTVTASKEGSDVCGKDELFANMDLVTII